MIPRQVVLMGSHYRPAPYRPPSLALSRPLLGQGSPSSFNWGNIGETIMFTAIGAGTMYAAPLFPDPIKTLAMVGGVGLIGYAAYSFLAPSKKSNADLPPGTPFPIATPEEFSKISGAFLNKAGTNVGYNFLGSTYPIKVMMSNQNTKTITVVLQLAARERVSLFYPIDSEFSEEYIAESKPVALSPGNTEVDFSPSVKSSRFIPGSIGVKLTLRAKRIPNEEKDITFTGVYVG